MAGLTLCVVCLFPPLLRIHVSADLRLLPLALLLPRPGPLGRWKAIMSLSPSPNLCLAGWPGRPVPPWHLAGGVGFFLSPYIIVDLSSPPQLPGQRAFGILLGFSLLNRALASPCFLSSCDCCCPGFQLHRPNTILLQLLLYLGGGVVTGWGGGIRGFQIPRPSGVTVGKPLGVGVSWAVSCAICSARPRRAHYRTSLSNCTVTYLLIHPLKPICQRGTAKPFGLLFQT